MLLTAVVHKGAEKNASWLVARGTDVNPYMTFRAYGTQPVLSYTNTMPT